ncbi:MAG: hypothetical protein ABW252_12280 [Polyangiales bacterium]
MATHGASAGSDLTVVTSYLSPDGPSVMEARGSLVVSSLQHLRDAKLYDAYVQQITPQKHEQLGEVLASSWVPVSLLLEHCMAIDGIGLSESHLQGHGEKIAALISESSFSIMMRTARGMGLDKALWWLLGQVDRLWPRLYRGGGCTVLRAGPKDAILEVHGQPLFTSRFFRTAHHAFVAGLVRSFADTSYVKPVRPREAHPHRAATAMSWV